MSHGLYLIARKIASRWEYAPEWEAGDPTVPPGQGLPAAVGSSALPGAPPSTAWMLIPLALPAGGVGGSALGVEGEMTLIDMRGTVVAAAAGIGVVTVTA